MRFIDWNGNGGIDSQDIATNVIVEESRRDDEHRENASQPLSSNAGCATMVALAAIMIIAAAIVL